MISKSTFTKTFTFCIATIFSLIAIISCIHIDANAFNYTQGIMFKEYYRLRNVKANLYLTMNTATDADNVGCSLKPRYSNNSTQIFYLDMDYNSNSYYFIPQSSSSARVLTTSSNNSLTLKTNTSSSSQKWIISRTVNGYGIRNADTSKYIIPSGSSTNSSVITGAFSTNTSEWILEPAYSGSASYFVTTNDLSNDNNSIVNRIVSKINNIGYGCERVDLPVTGRLMVRIPVNRLTVFHGHGSAGLIRLDQTDGSSCYLYSENSTSGNVEFDYFTQRNSYIMIISCNSAASTSSRCSLVQAAYNQGACCVTGFKNNVAGGEAYLEKVMYYVQKFPGMPIRDAMLNADEEYTAAQRQEDNCPANTDNRMPIGLSDMSINMN